MRGDRPDRVAPRAAELRGALLELPRRRGAAQARAEPDPPVWLAATSPDRSGARPRRATTYIHGSARRPPAESGQKRQLYFDKLLPPGFSTAGRELPHRAPARGGEPGLRGRPRWREPAPPGPCHRTRTRTRGRTAARPPSWWPISIARYLDDVIIHGSPERVADRIAELRESIGLEYLMCAPLSHEELHPVHRQGAAEAALAPAGENPAPPARRAPEPEEIRCRSRSACSR